MKSTKALGKISKKGVLVLRTLSENKDKMKLYGAQIKEATDISSGTLYPVLERLLSADLIACEKENTDIALKRPPRHYYNITSKGMAELERQMSLLRKKQILFQNKSADLDAIVGVKRNRTKVVGVLKS